LTIVELSVVAVGGVISVVAVALFSRRLGIAAPLLLVLAGVAIGTLPRVSATDIEPQWILGGVLPPLLYSAAINMPATDFRRNLKPITGLAVILVLASTAVAGLLFHSLIPEIGWPAAFALAAVLSPTDAVAATAVGRRLGLPSRLLVILEGEGLVNDATALVLLRTAVAAMGATVTAGGMIGDFALAVAGAILVGTVVGVVNVRVRRWINDPVMNTAISFVVPFLAYIPAEDFGFSGVLAVVVAGLVTGNLAARHLKAEDRIAEETNWRTLAFLMEGLIFLLMGISLEDVLAYAGDKGFSIEQAILYGLLAAVLLIALRFLFVVPLVALIRKDDERAAEALPRVKSWKEHLGHDGLSRQVGPHRFRRLERRVARASADIDFRLRESLGWRSGAVLAWSGMRGAVTVAAAQTLPLDTPYRAELVLIAYVGAAAMLLIQGSTLPWVIGRLNVEPDSPAELEKQSRALIKEIFEAGNQELDRLAAERTMDPAIVERVRKDTLLQVPHGRTQPALDQARSTYVELRLLVISAERDRLLHHQSIGTFPAAVTESMTRMLDLEEARLEQISDTHDTGFV